MRWMSRLTESTYRSLMGNKKWWKLTGNYSFSVKSFYNFLNDGGLRCSIVRFFWRNSCPKKINIFNWLGWKNKILTLENQESRRCNWLPTATCVLCHSAIELVDHLFLQCSFARQVWDYFVRLLHLPDSPLFLQMAWDVWRSLVRRACKDIGDLVVKAIVWNIWLVRNDCIFNANILHAHDIILKIDLMLLSWFAIVAKGVLREVGGLNFLLSGQSGVFRSSCGGVWWCSVFKDDSRS